MSVEIGDNLTERVSECCGYYVTLTGYCDGCGEHA
jgi:hypothetical protein